MSEDLSLPSYAVDVEALVALLDRVQQAATALLSSHDPTHPLPVDYPASLRAVLAADEPAGLLIDLMPFGRSDFDRDVIPLLADQPFIVGIQVLAAHGLLVREQRPSPWQHPPAERVRDLLGALHAAGRAPSLLQAEMLLAGLRVAGLDASRLLVRACVFPRLDSPPFVDGWETCAVEPWASLRVGLLVAEHVEEARVHGYSHPTFWALLGLVGRFPDDVADWLFAEALEARAAGCQEARTVLADHPSRASRSRDALAHRTVAVRVAAAAWLTDDPLPQDSEVVAALQDAVHREKDDLALGTLLDALVAHGLRAVDHLDRDALDQAAAKAAAKSPPAALAWLDVALLPKVRWSDTAVEVPVDTVRSWIQQAVKAKAVEPGSLLRTVLALVEADGRRAMADALLHLWLSAGAPSAARGVLAVVATGAGERAAGLAADFVRTRAKQQGAPAQALVGLLARIESPVAVQSLVEAADSSGSASVRKVAAAEVEALAARRGWTVEEVGDRGAPTAGFDAEGRMALDYGTRCFTAVLQPDLKVLVVADGGASKAALPPARASDDADQVAAARATLAAAKKTVIATARTQTARLRQAMAAQRSWTVEAWRTDVLGHPVLGRLATGLVWCCDGVAFRPLDDGTLTDADDEPVVLGDRGDVTLAHDVLLDAQQVEAWRTHLADYEVAVPFAQLGEPLPPFDPEATGLTDVVGVRTSAGGLHRLAEKAGFTRLLDGGVVAAYSRALVDDVGATLEVRGGAWVGDWAAEVELGVLLVTGPSGPVRLDALPPVVLAELRRDLIALGG